MFQALKQIFKERIFIAPKLLLSVLFYLRERQRKYCACTSFDKHRDNLRSLRNVLLIVYGIQPVKNSFVKNMKEI